MSKPTITTSTHTLRKSARPALPRPPPSKARLEHRRVAVAVRPEDVEHLADGARLGERRDAQLARAAGTAGQPVTSTAGGTLASQAPWIEGSSATPSRPTLPPLADATSSPPALHRTPPQPAGEASPGARAARRRAAREQASAALTNALDGEPAQGVAAGPAPEALAKAAVPVPAPVPAPSSPTADSVRARRAARAQAAAALP